jgi:Chaperone of endosialidase
MSTVIYNYNNTILTTIQDGVLDTSASPLQLPGNGYNNYSAPVLQDMIWTVQNFARGSAPNNPLQGMLWYNTNTGYISLYNGTTWVPLATATNNLIPSQDNTYNIGSADYRWANLWAVSGHFTSFTATNAYFTNITGDPSIMRNNQTNAPSIPDTWDLGAVNARWSNVWTDSLNCHTLNSDTINVGGSPVDVSKFMRTDTSNLPSVNATLNFGSSTLQWNTIYSSIGNFGTTVTGAILANGVPGNPGQILATTGTGIYWTDFPNISTSSIVNGSSNVAVANNAAITITATNTVVATFVNNGAQISSLGIGVAATGVSGQLITNGGAQLQSLGVGVPASGTGGEIRATGDITAFYTSDARFKQNVQPINDALSKVQQLSGVEFDWSDEFIHSRGGEDDYFVRRHDIGLIAQAVELVVPEVVATKPDGTKGVKYDRLVSVLIEAVKVLAHKVQTLEQKS